MLKSERNERFRRELIVAGDLIELNRRPPQELSDRLAEESRLCHSLGNIYIDRANRYNQPSDYIKASALYNAALVRTEVRGGKHEEILTSCHDVIQDFLQRFGGSYSFSRWKEDKTKNAKAMEELRRHVMDVCTEQRRKWTECVDDDGAFKSEQQETLITLSKAVSKDMTQRIQQFLYMLIEQSFHLIGHPPCSYAIIALGSLARGEVTPYSGFEFGILIPENENHNPEIRLYFSRLTAILHIKVLDFGETPLTLVGIASLNDYEGDIGGISKYYDDLTPSGLHFDGAMPWACKTPLGRETEGPEFDYSLISSPQEMAEIVTREHAPCHVISSLSCSSLIVGDEKLLKSFHKATRENILSAKPISDLASENLLMETLHYSSPILDHICGSMMMAYECCESVFTLIYHLALLLGVPCKTPWDDIQCMLRMGVLSPEAAGNLKLLASLAYGLKLVNQTQPATDSPNPTFSRSYILNQAYGDQNLIVYHGIHPILTKFHCIFEAFRDWIIESCNLEREDLVCNGNLLEDRPDLSIWIEEKLVSKADLTKWPPEIAKYHEWLTIDEPYYYDISHLPIFDMSCRPGRHHADESLLARYQKIIDDLVENSRELASCTIHSESFISLLTNLGFLCLQAGQIENARIYFDHGLRVNQKLPYANFLRSILLFGKALTHLLLGNLNDAALTSQVVLNLVPKSGQKDLVFFRIYTYLLLSSVLIELGQYNDSVSTAMLALGEFQDYCGSKEIQHPIFATFFFSKALSRHWHSKSVVAMKDCTQALEILSSSCGTDSHYMTVMIKQEMADIHLERSKPTEAMLCLEEARKTIANYSKSQDSEHASDLLLGTLGEAKAQLGEAENALNDLQKALGKYQNSPKNRRMKLKLMKITIALGDTQVGLGMNAEGHDTLEAGRKLLTSLVHPSRPGLEHTMLKSLIRASIDLGRLEDALKALDEMNAIGGGFKDRCTLTLMSLFEAEIYLAQGKLEKTLRLIQESEKYVTELIDAPKVVLYRDIRDIMLIASRLYFNIGDPPMALKLLHDLTRIVKKRSSHNEMIKVKMKLAEYFIAMEVYSKGCEVYKETIAYAQERDADIFSNERERNLTYATLHQLYGSTCAQLQTPESNQDAVRLLRVALQYFIACEENQENRRNAALCFLNMGRVEQRMAHHDLAIIYIQQSQKMYAHDDPTCQEIAEALSMLGDSNFVMGTIGEAREYYIQAIDAFRKFDQLEDLADCLFNMAECSSCLGNINEALAGAEESFALRLKCLPESHPKLEESKLQLQALMIKTDTLKYTEKEILNTVDESIMGEEPEYLESLCVSSEEAKVQHEEQIQPLASIKLGEFEHPHKDAELLNITEEIPTIKPNTRDDREEKEHHLGHKTQIVMMDMNPELTGAVGDHSLSSAATSGYGSAIIRSPKVYTDTPIPIPEASDKLELHDEILAPAFETKPLMKHGSQSSIESQG